MERASLFDVITEFPRGDSVFYYPEVKVDTCPLFGVFLCGFISLLHKTSFVYGNKGKNFSLPNTHKQCLNPCVAYISAFQELQRL